ncbi:MAG: DUF3626 domain-containing protein [Actinomycetota bacterium]|nr:DUF3626 domain-containing protein [Actinomycetota bacterium]MDA8355756.1 DUF3626 domain-containing protein [Actinomycetota bacterium]
MAARVPTRSGPPAGRRQHTFAGRRFALSASASPRSLGDGSGRIDAELVGRAARLVVTDPERFADHGDASVTLQHLKQLWHVLVAHGHPSAL